MLGVADEEQEQFNKPFVLEPFGTFDLEPHGVSLTKRLVVPALENILHKPQVIGTNSIARVVGYMGGDAAIERSATAGLGMERAGLSSASQEDFFSYLRSAGIIEPFRWLEIKIHADMPITSALTVVPEKRASVNEYSGRYSKMSPSFGIPDEAVLVHMGVPAEKAASVRKRLSESCAIDYAEYERLLDLDLARELAREGLGEGNITKFYWKMDLEDALWFAEYQKRHENTKNGKSELNAFVQWLDNVLKLGAPAAYEAFQRVENRHEQVTDLDLEPTPSIAKEIAKPQLPQWKPAETLRRTISEAEGQMFVPAPYLDKGWLQMIEYEGGDGAIAQAARVSYGSGTRKRSSDAGLIRYLKSHEHVTPTEMVDFGVEAVHPTFNLRQIIRHRTADKTGFMGKFVPLPLFYMPTDDQYRMQNKKNKQGRGLELSSEDKEKAKKILEGHEARQFDLEEELISEGVPWQARRMGLGVGRYTFWNWKIDLNNAFRMLSLRLDSHAQHEVREMARIISDQYVQRLVPDAYKAFMDYNFDATNLSSLDAVAASKFIDFSFIDKPEAERIQHYQSLGLTSFVKYSKKEGAYSLNREGEEFEIKLKKIREVGERKSKELQLKEEE